MQDNAFAKSAKYTDLETIYRECSGPGGLQLAEMIADRMGIRQGAKLIDIGYNRGYQTCFLIKEYGVCAVAIDPLDDLDTGLPHSGYLMANAEAFGVVDRVLPVKVGVPDTCMPDGYFDYAYSTTTLEMVRGYVGMDAYRASLEEILRILKPGGVFGLGEPMHFAAPVPEDLKTYVEANDWEACFATLDETRDAVRVAGFDVLEAGYCDEADRWWREFARYEPGCDPNDVAVIERNNGRWLSFGYVVGRKPG